MDQAFLFKPLERDVYRPTGKIDPGVLQDQCAHRHCIGVAAFALGFKDTAYFSRFFAKHTGRSPRSWRRSVSARGEAARLPAPTLQFADWP